MQQSQQMQKKYTLTCLTTRKQLQPLRKRRLTTLEDRSCKKVGDENRGVKIDTTKKIGVINHQIFNEDFAHLWQTWLKHHAIKQDRDVLPLKTL